jgi:hypothetical protein
LDVRYDPVAFLDSGGEGLAAIDHEKDTAVEIAEQPGDHGLVLGAAMPWEPGGLVVTAGPSKPGNPQRVRSRAGPVAA